MSFFSRPRAWATYVFPSRSVVVKSKANPRRSIRRYSFVSVIQGGTVSTPGITRPQCIRFGDGFPEALTRSTRRCVVRTLRGPPRPTGSTGEYPERHRSPVVVAASRFSAMLLAQSGKCQGSGDRVPGHGPILVSMSLHRKCVLHLFGWGQKVILLRAADQVRQAFFELHGFGEIPGQFRQEAAGLHHDEIAAAIAVDLRQHQI